MLKLLALILVLQVVNNAHFGNAEVIDKGTYLLECSQDPLELGIVLDSSLSIRRDPFNKGKEFLQDFLSQYTISPDKVRVSLISYGRGIYTQEAFNLPDHTTSASLLSAVGALNWMQGGYTATGEGINYMSTSQLSRDVTRDGVGRVAIVLTDGNSQNWRLTKSEAEAARATGIVMIAVGVGNVKDSELMNIAGDRSRVLRVDSYDKLKSIMTKLASTTCIKRKKPTTPPPPKYVCGSETPADIYFVFSAADIGTQTSAWTKTAIAQTVRNEDIQEGFRIGVATGSCPDDQGFDLDQYLLPGSTRQLIAHLEPLSSPRLPPLVERVMTVGYSVEHGGRAAAERVAVLVAPGGRKNMRLRAGLVAEAEKLVAGGIKVFILDPHNTEVSAAGAVTISNNDPTDASAILVQELCPGGQY